MIDPLMVWRLTLRQKGQHGGSARRGGGGGGGAEDSGETYQYVRGVGGGGSKTEGTAWGKCMIGGPGAEYRGNYQYVLVGGWGVWGQLHEGLRKVTFANTIESKCTSVSGRLWRQLHEVWERSPLQTL